MLVTIKFRLDHTWDEYMAENDELLLEDMFIKLRDGITDIEVEKIEKV